MQPTSSCSAKLQRRRAGFTLVEVLIAVILIDVGLLALVAGSAVLVRQANDTRVRGAALRTAENRLETLGAAACTSLAGVATSPDGLREVWSVEMLPNSVGEMRDSVVFATNGSTRSLVLRTRIPC